jgi:lipoprotein-releasing system permease protein
VAVGVMVLIVVIAVMTGFETEVTQRMLRIEPHILVMRYGDPIDQPNKVVKKLENITGVNSATPIIYSQAMLRSKAGSSAAILKGIDPISNRCRLKTVNNQCIDTKLSSGDKRSNQSIVKGIILGKELAEKLKAKKGDMLHLISASGMTGNGRIPPVKRVKVLDLFETGMSEYDSGMAILAVSDLQRLLDMGSMITGIEVRTQDIFMAHSVKETIMQTLDLPYFAQDWMQIHKPLFAMLKLQKVVLFIILILIVLVAAFNIASALIMMVMEKTRDIAILKTLGATNKSIRRIFMLRGMVIGLVGTILGLILGIIICILLQRYQFIHLSGDVYFGLDTLPVRLEIWDAVIIVSSTLLICFLSTLYPAWQASRFNPVDGIRYG